MLPVWIPALLTLEVVLWQDPNANLGRLCACREGENSGGVKRFTGLAAC